MIKSLLAYVVWQSPCWPLFIVCFKLYFTAYEAEDAATQGITNTTQTHVLVVDVDAACANETVSLVKLLEDISDAGLLVKVPGRCLYTMTETRELNV